MTAESSPSRADSLPIVPGRACGTCTLCCKVIGVGELDKQPGVWCPNCKSKKGCGIYETRPTSCRTFFCLWMYEKGLTPEWKPEHAKFALVTSDGGRFLTAFVDPGAPTAWRRSPYYETLQRWALEGARDPSGPRVVSVRIRARGIVLLPDREVEIGDVGPDEAIMLDTGPGGRLEVRKFKRPNG